MLIVVEIEKESMQCKDMGLVVNIVEETRI